MANLTTAYHPRRLSFGYRGRLLLAILSVNLVILPILTINRVWLTRQFVRERELNRIHGMAQILGDEILENISQNDTTDLREILTLSADQKDVRFVAVVDAAGRVRYSTAPEGADSTPNGNTIVATFPLRDAAGTRGQVRIGYSPAAMRRDIRSSLVWALALDTVLVAFVLLAAWWFSKRLTKPLDEMKLAAARIASGDFSTRVSVRSADSIGELGTALNEMARQLGDLTDHLQERVDSAVRELDARNRQLSVKTRQLEESNARLKELDSLKSDFVTMVSHELRTPLTSIIGFTRTLRTLPLPEKQKSDYLGIIETEGRRLASLVEEHLDVTKIESGTLALNLTTFDLLTVLRHEVAVAAQNGRGIAAALVVDRDPLPVTADRNRIARVVLNLVENAFAYGAAGQPVTIAVRAVPGEVQVAIHNVGEPIPAHEIDRIFDKFYRGAAGSKHRRGGCGIGLTIAQGIVNAHDGRIWVESTANDGTTVTFTLPATVHQTPEASPVTQDHGGAA